MYNVSFDPWWKPSMPENIPRTIFCLAISSPNSAGPVPPDFLLPKQTAVTWPNCLLKPRVKTVDASCRCSVFQQEKPCKTICLHFLAALSPCQAISTLCAWILAPWVICFLPLVTPWQYAQGGLLACWTGHLGDCFCRSSHIFLQNYTLKYVLIIESPNLKSKS